MYEYLALMTDGSVVDTVRADTIEDAERAFEARGYEIVDHADAVTLIVKEKA